LNNIQRTLLEKHLFNSADFFKGRLLNAGCGDISYEYIFKAWVDSYIRLDWPNTVHKKNLIDVFGSVTELPFADNSFDTILCTEVLEHVPEPQKTLQEFFRVLKPEGHVILSVPFLYQVHEQPYDFFRYTNYGLRYLFEKAGFRVIKCLARGELIAVGIFFFKQFLNRMAIKILGTKISEKIPYLVLDTIYLKTMRNKVVQMNGHSTNYTLGYTVVAFKSQS
jgi:SAM-dependent methyltransferase